MAGRDFSFLDFELMMALKLNENMPEDLRDNLSGYLDKEVAGEANIGLSKIIKKYCEDNNIEGINTDTVKRTEMISPDMEDPSIQMEKFFSDIGKKRGIEIKKQTDTVENYTEEIENISKSINSDSSEDEKSLCAYKILCAKIKLEYQKYSSSLNNDIFSINERIEILKNSKEELRKDSSLLKVDAEYNRVKSVVEQTLSDLNKLITIDEEEYMKQDFESRGKYLSYTKKELDKTEDFLKEELLGIKSKVMVILATKLGLGEHMSIVIA